MPTPVRFQVTVARVDRHGPDVATLYLSSPTHRLRFRPGQFVHLTLDAYVPNRHWPTSRALSIASAPGADLIRLTISRQGRYTARMLEEIAVGQQLWIKGPYGEFVVEARSPDDRIILIAGGTGITPFCAYLEQRLQLDTPRSCPVTLYYGAREAGLLVYRDLAERCARQLSGFSVRYFVEQGEIPAGTTCGRLDVDQIVSDQPDPSAGVYYLSGPKAMVDAFSTRLTSVHGLPPDRVAIDAWE